MSAAAALILSNQPGLANETVRALLVNSADDLGDPGWDDKYGAGRLNMLRALGVFSPVLALQDNF